MSDERHGLNFGDRAIEWLCAFVMVWLAVAFAMPGDVLAQPAFVGFTRLGLSEDFLVCVFGIAGGARIVALVVNGRWPRTPTIRMVCAGFGFWVFGQMSWLFAEGAIINHGPFQTGVGVYGLLALSDLFSIYRAARDARYYHR